MNIPMGLLLGVLLLPVFGQAASMSDYVLLPPTILDSADPNVMFDLSIETPMQGAAYNDQPATGCGGRINDGGTVGICYTATNTYIGYFDANKCYDYVTANSRFEPVAATAADHSCSGYWSGNFLNWATMTAIDEFRWALTGGNRQTDSTTMTVLERANMGLSQGNSWYPIKMITAASNVAPATVTPYSDAKIYIYNHGYQVDIGTSWGGSQKAANLYVRARVCDSVQGLEGNCVQYGSNYKPEGLIQDNAYRMRFALMSYARDNDKNRDGGVLRANMKYVGTTRPATAGGMESNPKAEINSNGIFVQNADQVTLASGVSNSGIINYINKFGASGYKSYDPAGELFYEVIKYFKHLSPTTDYSSGLTDAEKDGFPVLTTWEDPIQHACQKNFIIGINDANPWLDKQLPGSYVTCGRYFNCTTGTALAQDATDYGNPGTADPDINVTTLTNTVGQLQGINGTSQCIGCTSTSCNWSATNKTINNLGQVFGTCPYPAKENSYYIAGLSYYGRAWDLRSDFADRQTISTFMVDTQEYNATPLTGQMNMLWLAGKYGGFKEQDFLDTNSDGVTYEPNLAAEWDADGDGQPDNYVLATDPTKLVDGLTRAFSDITERVSSATAASVIANSYTGTGAIFQALYSPKEVQNNKQVAWVGTLHALFFDDASRLREDGDGDGVLDVCNTDPVVQIYYDAVNQEARVRRYSTAADCDIDAPGVTYSDLDLSALRPIWSARNRLAEFANGVLASQRGYTTPSAAGRHILTWPGSGGLVDFTAANFTAASNYYYLRAASGAEAANIVNWVRGDDSVSGYRSRTIDFDNDGVEEVWRLGDIIHSTPVAVGAPGGSYGKKYYDLYNDTTYRTFQTRYADRRQMVYVGANDGMLHAFNGGFWSESDKSFSTSSGALPAHGLGDEVWAYVPFNLLPHLKWLTGNDYSHVYYMDGPIHVFDARIFDADETHPGGWGTILVAGMRFGGGDLDIDNNGTADSRSAFVILDVTDPEQPPALVAEITHADLGFTTSEPALMVRRAPNDSNDWSHPDIDQWYLVFGSGPNDLDTATANRNAKLFVYDLAARQLVTGYDPYDLVAALAVGDSGYGVTTSFVGSVASVDWTNDYKDDAAYFGTDGYNGSAQAGRLFRLVMADTAVAWQVKPLFDQGQPVVSRPLLSKDGEGAWWVHAGTGRLWVSNDNRTIPQQAYYGIKEPKDVYKTPTWEAVTVDTLQNVTGIQVFLNGGLADTGGVLPVGTTLSYQGLLDVLASKSGWYRYFTYDGSTPSTRNLTSAVGVGGMVAFTDYTPPADACEAEGSSYLYVVSMMTGTAVASAVLGSDATTTQDGAEKSEDKKSLGKGMASSPVVHQGTGHGSGEVTIVTQSSTGAITTTNATLPVPGNGRVSWREITNF